MDTGGQFRRGLRPEQIGQGLRGVELQLRLCFHGGKHPRAVQMVRVFVGDQDGVGILQGRLHFGKAPGIQHQDLPALFEADTGMRELRHFHSATLLRGQRAVQDAAAGLLIIWRFRSSPGTGAARRPAAQPAWRNPRVI